MNLNNRTIAVIGLGYVGLPLAVEFGKKRPVIGFDIKADRVAELKSGHDHTLEVSEEELREAKHLTFTPDVGSLRSARDDGGMIFIVTVPTPVDKANRPDLTPLIKASETVGRVLKAGDVVIYESTVYPGCTEEVCAPILERESGLRYIIEDANADAFPGFYCGYSPERINPGDKTHRLPSIKKVTSGSTLATAQAVDNLYKEIISAGTHLASSIKVAEAAKVIENTQRDLNIALMNELSMIFSRMNIDTRAVLDAASTKWNFLNFYPGLVGGHCIGVDPYYLTHKAQMLGYDPQVILAGRRINDSMGKFVSDKTIQSMIKAKIPLDGAKVILLGLTFKENCPDTRNSRVPALVRELESYGLEVFAHDPFADANEAYAEYGLRLMQWDALPMADAVLVAVRHQFYRERGPTEIIKKMKKNCGITDVKGLFSASDFPNASFFWTL